MDYFIVDAFTTNCGQPFTGNPAGVCLLEADDDLADDAKQKLVGEIIFGAFVSRSWTRATLDSQQPKQYYIRWFSSATEVPLCGHATLASAHVLFDRMEINSRQQNTTITFVTRFSGHLQVTKNWSTGDLSMNFPCHRPEKISLHDQRNQWLNKVVDSVLNENLTLDDVEEISFASNIKILVIQLKNREALTKTTPNFGKMLEAATKNELIEAIVTVKADDAEDEVHFFSRCFCPWLGVDEDPATGSAHMVLAAFWTKEYGSEQVLVGLQKSSRGGLVKCRVDGERVMLSGAAKTVLKGQLMLTN